MEYQNMTKLLGNTLETVRERVPKFKTKNE